VTTSGLHLNCCKYRFLVGRYSMSNLSLARHDYELQPDGINHVYLDHLHMGLGGDDSWSPSLHEVRILWVPLPAWTIWCLTACSLPLFVYNLDVCIRHQILALLPHVMACPATGCLQKNCLCDCARRPIILCRRSIPFHLADITSRCICPHMRPYPRLQVKPSIPGASGSS